MNWIRLALFETNNAIFGPYLSAMNTIIISGMMPITRLHRCGQGAPPHRRLRRVPRPPQAPPALIRGSQSRPHSWLPLRQCRPGGTKTDVTEVRILSMAAKQGPHVLFCTPNRTKCILLVSVILDQYPTGNQHRLPQDFAGTRHKSPNLTTLQPATTALARLTH
jgi:hypothetical protein